MKHTKESILKRLANFDGKRLANTSGIKAQLIRTGILLNQCYICGLPPVWQNKTLSLHLDHIDGNAANNKLKNLRILCPNCHSQTDSFAGKNKHRYGKRRCQSCNKILKVTWAKSCLPCHQKHREDTKKAHYCVDCGILLVKGNSATVHQCHNCYSTKPLKNKISWPTNEELINLIEAAPSFEKLAAWLNVSSNAIRKHCVRRGIDYKSLRAKRHI